MAVADILSDIGQGVEKVGKVAGAIAAPLGKSVAEEEAGYAPQIAQEKRAQQEKLEDAAINAKVTELENQLNIGQNYGTLNPQQQKQYVEAISQLYLHPRHATTLMEKLRQAVHPNGAVATPNALSTLKNATPDGGMAEADEKRAEKLARERYAAARANNPKLAALDKFTQEKYGTAYGDSTPEQQEESLQAYVRASTKGSVGKSPPLPGNQLPPDAVGADGQPIGPAARDAAHSFVEYNGSWWPVAKAKPVFKTVKGHSVLVDGQSGAILRDLGPVGTAKVTTRQTLQPGDDGQMHLVNLTSVTTPEGASIEVDPGSGSTEPPSENKPVAQPKPKGVGGILKPHTTARPVPTPTGGVSAGKVVPGLSTLARSKNPLYKADTAIYKKASDDLVTKKEAYESAQKALASGSTASSDQELIYSWVRSNVQGAGRMTQAEFRQAAATGSLPLRAQTAWERTKTGKLPPELEQMFLADIQRSYQTAQQIVTDLRGNLESPSSGSSPAQPKVIVVSAEDMK